MFDKVTSWIISLAHDNTKMPIFSLIASGHLI
jgi:hypothetical protein